LQKKKEKKDGQYKVPHTNGSLGVVFVIVRPSAETSTDIHTNTHIYMTPSFTLCKRKEKVSFGVIHSPKMCRTTTNYEYSWPGVTNNKEDRNSQVFITTVKLLLNYFILLPHHTWEANIAFCFNKCSWLLKLLEK